MFIVFMNEKIRSYIINTPCKRLEPNLNYKSSNKSLKTATLYVGK